ncbi:hypothetical protein KIPB_005774 [Kipferlia bialata]|uniref:Uncharacterized protein n=1 Tax=Kipferlia bialata TaxID=797122 RepID=A0A391NWE6_9EUKA|nr:hypothetical protein KIPB_005774 [Kipferlia bialata]|eukprot:g5774.t1
MNVMGRRLFCTNSDTLTYLYTSVAQSISLSGTVTSDPVVYTDSDSVVVTERTLQSTVEVGSCICIFGTGSRAGYSENTVYMYDVVSSDAVPYEPLPVPEPVYSACMLNPTTMLVVHSTSMSVIELDPGLFERFTDAD